MPGTSPSGLNQIERNHLTVASCKCGRLHIRRQLERRKISNHPICRCRSRSPVLCQRHQDLTDKRVGHVSFPTKRQKAVYVLLCRIRSYSGCRRLEESSDATFKVSRICSEVNTSGRLTPPRSTLLGSTPRSRIPHQSTELQPRSSSQLSSTMWGPTAPIPTSQRP
jgi:hypothetical protein